ncbi:MAG: diguanylate cyclase regulator RdcB family protein [Rivularia sp. (in: cyanobacteria)]
MTNSEMFPQTFMQIHPQLSEKAIVDYINGLEVINDQVNVSKQIIRDGSFLNKILDSITGKNQQRQLIINQNTATSLEVISVWLQELECYKIDNDVVITHLTTKLCEVRNATTHLSGKISEVDDRIVELQNKADLKFIQLNKRVHRVEAKNHVDLVVTKWKNELWTYYPVLASLFLCIDELYWGDFGTYCRTENNLKKVSELVDYLRGLVLGAIKNKLGVSKNELFIVFKLLEPIVDLSDEQLEMLAYLCDWANFQTAPFTWFINGYATNYTPQYALKYFPIVLNSTRLFDRLLDENNERAKPS